MKKKLSLIIGTITLVIIIIVCILLGMPKEENTIFSFEEPILYIKSHAKISPNTDFESLNQNYNIILTRNGLNPESIRRFLKEQYKQNNNIYLARFVSVYEDTYIIGFNLDTNEVSLKRLTKQEIEN